MPYRFTEQVHRFWRAFRGDWFESRPGLFFYSFFDIFATSSGGIRGSITTITRSRAFYNWSFPSNCKIIRYTAWHMHTVVKSKLCSQDRRNTSLRNFSKFKREYTGFHLKSTVTFSVTVVFFLATNSNKLVLYEAYPESKDTKVLNIFSLISNQRTTYYL